MGAVVIAESRAGTTRRCDGTLWSVARILAALLFAAGPAAAVVDIAPREVGDKPGFSGNVNLSLSDETGNTDNDDLDIGALVQYDSDRSWIAFAQGTYETSEKSGVETEDERLTHARYLRKLNRESLYAEVFGQLYENTFKGIENRWLAGGNLRWRFLPERPIGKCYLGTGAFHESQDFTDDYADEDGTAIRLNSYLAYAREFTDTVEFTAIAYYQPSVSEFADYYTALNTEFKVHVVSGMHLSITYEVDRDSQAPEDIEKVDRELSVSLVWEF